MRKRRRRNLRGYMLDDGNIITHVLEAFVDACLWGFVSILFVSPIAYVVFVTLSHLNPDQPDIAIKWMMKTQFGLVFMVIVWRFCQHFR